ncbi:hypothetical protein [uncultured Tateyamaria sp.]|uniref:hypothetical protein n=1 Tax=uncultured Tateyamaria sp. TaxID=455651 RepID=UPI002603D7C3|nr:hypothetical protein [uncultured Tateyamaria sp.]
MSAPDVLRPDGSDYDAFLQAEVGEDRTGAAVTVLSALALASQSRATKLVSLLPKQAPFPFVNECQTGSFSFPRVRLFWILSVLVGVAVIARIYSLAQMG